MVALAVGARQVVARHPRHLLLAMLVAGLLAGPRSPPASIAVAMTALALARSGTLALGAVAALLAGAAIADARLAALDRSALAPLINRELRATATLLEHPRKRTFGVRVAAARLLSGAGRGERVLLLAAARVRWPRHAQPGTELHIRGGLARLAPTTTTSAVATPMRSCAPNRSSPRAGAGAASWARSTRSGCAPSAR